MGGRGTFASGKKTTLKYETVGILEGIKILKGINGAHSLPEESHSSKAYIKLKPSGVFHEMRIYDNEHYLTMEIAYHPEPNLGFGNILHYHVYDRNFNRSKAKPLNDKLYKKYKKYFIGVKND